MLQSAIKFLKLLNKGTFVMTMTFNETINTALEKPNLLSFNSYTELYPLTESALTWLRSPKTGHKHEKVICQGFLRWDELEASLWYPPWEGGYVFVSIVDVTDLTFPIESGLPPEADYTVYFGLQGADDRSATCWVKSRDTASVILDRIKRYPIFATLEHYNFSIN